MPVKPYDKLCGARHWSWEPHEYPKGLEVRDMVRQFNGKVIEGAGRIVEPVTAVVPVTKVAPTVTKVMDVTDSFVTCAGPGCQNVVPPGKTGRPGKYCKDSCRIAAHRAKSKGS